MPIMDGYNAAKSIRAFDDVQAQVPLLHLQLQFQIILNEKN
jgi:hypothetical protein